jgi:hypothetical protein
MSKKFKPAVMSQWEIWLKWADFLGNKTSSSNITIKPNLERR